MQNELNKLEEETNQFLENEEKTYEQKQLEKFESLSAEPVKTTWGREHEREAKVKKAIKVSLVSSIASVIVAGLSALVCVGCAIGEASVLDKTDYHKENALYKQEVTAELAEQLANNEITYEEYFSKVKSIKDLDAKEYMQENASAEQLRKFNNRHTAKNVSGGIGIAGCGVGFVSAFTGIGVTKAERNRKNKENARQARISRLLGR